MIILYISEEDVISNMYNIKCLMKSVKETKWYFKEHTWKMKRMEKLMTLIPHGPHFDKKKYWSV